MVVLEGPNGYLILSLVSLIVVIFLIGFTLGIYHHLLIFRVLKIAKKLNPKKKYSLTDFHLVTRLKAVKNKRITEDFRKIDGLKKMILKLLAIIVILFILLTVILVYR